MVNYLIGIDIGSTCAKTIVMDENRRILRRFLQPTGWSSLDTAQAIRNQLSAEKIDMGRAVTVATGYGRISVPYADRCVTEITCHAKGTCYIHGLQNLTVIDIGGQDTKIIRVEKGTVTDFLMNDKCSAGTGRFLEIMSNTLAVRPEALCSLAARGGNTSISSMCTVFAESEVISLIGRGEPRENIAFAVVDSIVQKVASQAGRMLAGQTTICLTGGLCDFPYLRDSLAKALRCPVLTNRDGRYAGAIGAALSAAAFLNRGDQNDLSG
jgi:predicted CoA-substrate-specific enzyme activase